MIEARAPSTWTGWLWLTLAAVLVHALLPVGSPVVRTVGSPFSSATVDVSTAPARRLLQAKEVRTDDRPDGPDRAKTLWSKAFLASAGKPLATAPAATPQAAGPSVRRPAASSGLSQARAPPLA